MVFWNQRIGADRRACLPPDAAGAEQALSDLDRIIAANADISVWGVTIPNVEYYAGSISWTNLGSDSRAYAYWQRSSESGHAGCMLSLAGAPFDGLGDSGRCGQGDRSEVEEGEEPSILDFAPTEYGRTRKVLASAEIKKLIREIGIKRCARESGFDRKNFIRKLLRDVPVKRNSYEAFVRWLHGDKALDA